MGELLAALACALLLAAPSATAGETQELRCLRDAYYAYTKAQADYYRDGYEAAFAGNPELYKVARAWMMAGLARTAARWRQFTFAMREEPEALLALETGAELQAFALDDAVLEAWRTADPQAEAVLARVRAAESKITPQALEALKAWLAGPNANAQAARTRRACRVSYAWERLARCRAAAHER